MTDSNSEGVSNSKEHKYVNINSGPSLEKLLSNYQQVHLKEKNEINNIDLKQFKINNLNKKYEDMLYYFLPPENLKNYKSIDIEENNYQFLNDLNNENFFLSQDVRADIINNISDTNSSINKSFLNNFNEDFCPKNSFSQKNEENLKNMINLNKFKIIFEKFSLLCLNENDENKLLSYINEIYNGFMNNKFQMESIGLINFNLIEDYFHFLLNLVIKKLDKIKDPKILYNFILLCIKILKYFKSTKLLFFIIQFFQKYNSIIDLKINEKNKDILQFIPNNCFNFELIRKNIEYIIFPEIIKAISNESSIFEDNKRQLDLKEHWSLNFGDFLFIFIKSALNKDIEINEKKNYNELVYLKINLIERKLIKVGNVKIIEDKKDEFNQEIIDMNISLKNDLIFVFYVIHSSKKDEKKYFLKYKLFNHSTMSLIKENDIILKNDFIPKKLFNDNKYLYCTSKLNELMIIKKNFKLNYQEYNKYEIKLYGKDMNLKKDIYNIDTFSMHNSLCINNLFIIENNVENTNYVAKFQKNKNGNYTLFIYELYNGNKSEDSLIIKVSCNDNKFVLTKLDINKKELYFNMSTNNLNNLIDKGISLLPFETNYYHKDEECSNLYEYLLQQYSFLLNICGNYSIINSEYGNNIIKYPFYLCNNFEQSYLDIIIKNILEMIIVTILN